MRRSTEMTFWIKIILNTDLIIGFNLNTYVRRKKRRQSQSLNWIVKPRVRTKPNQLKIRKKGAAQTAEAVVIRSGIAKRRRELERARGNVLVNNKRLKAVYGLILEK